MQRGYPFIHKTKRYKPEKLSGMPKTRRQYKPLTPRTDFPTLPLPNPPTPLNYQSHQFPLSPTRSRLPKYPILSGVAHTGNAIKSNFVQLFRFGVFPLPSLFVLPITLIFLSTSIHLTPLQELGASISKERIELAATRSGLLATESS